MIRFDQFMQQALHHPERGYYARKINTVGAQGDFSTTATLSPILGRAIACSFFKYKHTRHLIEIGGGDGSLAQSVLGSIPFCNRFFIHYHIVDTSSPLTSVQKRKLGGRVHWHTDMKSALKKAKGNAFIFSNELVDAFPVRIFQRSNETLTELHLKGTEEHFREAHAPDIYSSALSDKKLTENTRVELHESYYDWFQDWLPHWKKGQMLTIDYGDTYPDLYYRMPNGTLRAYAHHQRITGPAVYLNPGHQDITVDVNFSDLIQWGENLGLDTVQYLSQNEYLQPHMRQNNEADQFLTADHGAGTAFKVLIQQKTI